MLLRNTHHEWASRPRRGNTRLNTSRPTTIILLTVEGHPGLCLSPKTNQYYDQYYMHSVTITIDYRLFHRRFCNPCFFHECVIDHCIATKTRVIVAMASIFSTHYASFRLHEKFEEATRSDLNYKTDPQFIHILNIMLEGGALQYNNLCKMVSLLAS